MKFKEFLAKIAPSISKRTVISHLDGIQESLKTYTIPSNKQMEQAFGKSGFNSPEGESFQKTFTKLTKQANMFKTINNVYETCDYLIEYLHSEIDAKFEEDITRASLSMYMLNVLKLVQVIDFMVDFGRRLNLYLVTKEFSVVIQDDSLIALTDSTKAEEDFINGYKYAFINGCIKLNHDVKKLEKQINEIPNILVNVSNIDDVKDVTGLRQADPMSLDGFIVNGNIFAIVGMRIATYQAKKYKQAQHDLEETQAKLLYLKQQAAGKSDAKIEKQIAYYTDRNNKLKAEIAQMDEDYGLNQTTSLWCFNW